MQPVGRVLIQHPREPQAIATAAMTGAEQPYTTPSLFGGRRHTKTKKARTQNKSPLTEQVGRVV